MKARMTSMLILPKLQALMPRPQGATQGAKRPSSVNESKALVRTPEIFDF